MFEKHIYPVIAELQPHRRLILIVISLVQDAGGEDDDEEEEEEEEADENMPAAGVAHVISPGRRHAGAAPSALQRSLRPPTPIHASSTSSPPQSSVVKTNLPRTTNDLSSIMFGKVQSGGSKVKVVRTVATESRPKAIQV